MIKREDIKYRIGDTYKDASGKPYAVSCLIYIDARTAMDELDTKFGQLNWKFSWEQILTDKWAIRGILEVLNQTTKEWVKFQDVGYPQEEKKTKDSDTTEWMKDAVSDALKRCAVHLGIGRELYDAPFLYTEEIEVNKWGRVKLTKSGEQIIQGNIDKWYAKLTNLEKDSEEKRLTKDNIARIENKYREVFASN